MVNIDLWYSTKKHQIIDEAGQLYPDRADLCEGKNLLHIKQEGW